LFGEGGVEEGMGFPEAVKEEALVRSRRHCCLCHKFAGVYTNVHHIDQEADGGANDLDNAVVLCLECHGQVGHYNLRHPIGDKYRPSEVKQHRDLWWEWCKDNPFAPIATDPTSDSRRPLKIVRSFAASIVFDEAEDLPQVFFNLDNDIGNRLASKSSVGRPYDNIDGKMLLMVQVPVTDGEKFLHGVDTLQCKMLMDICGAQRGGSTWGWSADQGIIPTKVTTPNTPEPITRLPGAVILNALAQNRFAQTGMIRLEFEYSEIPFPDGTSVWLEPRPSQPGVGPEQRRVVVAVAGKAKIVVSLEPLVASGAGALPQGASVPEEVLKHCRTFTFSVRVDAEIIRSGNHEDVIQDYKVWIEWLASELQSHNAD
jgi:HNH endonuclease